MARGNTDEEALENNDKKAQYGCELAPKLPPGVSMLDVRQQKWTIGTNEFIKIMDNEMTFTTKFSFKNSKLPYFICVQANQ